MRFFADGPSIPDELLTARDQDRVVFFCGAGVSRAKANLPDFFGLARQVTKTLGVPADAPAMKLLAEAEEIGNRLDIGGLIPADRVFGLLERDFLSRDIYRAVATALTPQNNPDLSAHEILLKLATTRQGAVRLVTTNFDRLFDASRPELQTYYPPKLPDLSREEDFNGVIYLHGKINGMSDGAEGGEFVLSSSEFGRAYLSEGWATSFVKEILSNYLVVFVGYSADDPPVQYLLEALNGSTGSMGGVYAFQSGAHDDAAAKWRHKGVTAIPYSEVNAHKALWETLEAWAMRADDPTKWVDNIIGMARSGPENLQPFERGQVAHVVSTVEGARKFGEGVSLPPATWLCVFDPECRYAQPWKIEDFKAKDVIVDPFDIYALDSDPQPVKVNFDDEDSPERKAPSFVWDAFALTKEDNRRDQNQANNNQRRGNWFSRESRLSARQELLGLWISRLVDEPASIWWAVRQHWLHPNICTMVLLEIGKAAKKSNPSLRKAWRYLIDYWGEGRNWEGPRWHFLISEINAHGWDEVYLRRFASMSRPYIKINKGVGDAPSPNLTSNCQLNDIVNFEIKYPDIPHLKGIPDDYLLRFIVELRRSLEIALELETEIGGDGLTFICTLLPYKDTIDTTKPFRHGICAWLHYFIRYFEELISIDLESAKAEFLKWPNDIFIFSRLRLWALGKKGFLSDEQFGTVFNALSDDVLWDSFQMPDVLIALRNRWNELGESNKKKVEQRLLSGAPQEGKENIEQFSRRRARCILNALHWLHDQKINFQFDIGRITEELKRYAPDWSSEDAIKAIRPIEVRCGWGSVKTDYSALMNEPLGSVLVKAEALLNVWDGSFVELDPFAGLSQHRPVRAFAALRLAAKKGDFPKWAWETFLNTEYRKFDNVRFAMFIAEQVSRYSDHAVAKIVPPVAGWIQKTAKKIVGNYPHVFWRLADRLISALFLQTDESKTTIIRGNGGADWGEEAINSPTGKFVDALLADPSINALEKYACLPSNFRLHAEKLLSLPDDLHRHALVQFSRRLIWFFDVDPEWTRVNLVGLLDSEDVQDHAAIWAGFSFCNGDIEFELFSVLKPYMLTAINSEDGKNGGHAEIIAETVLSAWASQEKMTGKPWVTDEEMRLFLLNSGNDLRAHVLWEVNRLLAVDRGNWFPLTLKLLRDVWPRQISVMSESVSTRLFDLVLSEHTGFPELVAAVLPLLTPIGSENLALPILDGAAGSSIRQNPLEALSLLCAVLPDSVANWPYGIAEMLKFLGDAGESVRNDARFIELKRKWDSR